ELSVGAGVKKNNRPTNCTRRFRKFHGLLGGSWELRIEHNAKQADTREKFMEQAEPFRLQVTGENVDTRCVSAGPVQARDQPRLDRISAVEDDRYARGRGLCRQPRRG